MTRRTVRAIDVVVALLLLAAACGAVFVLAVVWAADFDPNSDSESSGAAGASAMILALGVAVGVVAGIVRRSWRTLALVLVVAGLVAALAWVPLL